MKKIRVHCLRLESWRGGNWIYLHTVPSSINTAHYCTRPVAPDMGRKITSQKRSQHTRLRDRHALPTVVERLECMVAPYRGRLYPVWGCPLYWLSGECIAEREASSSESQHGENRAVILEKGAFKGQQIKETWFREPQPQQIRSKASRQRLLHVLLPERGSRTTNWVSSTNTLCRECNNELRA